MKDRKVITQLNDLRHLDWTKTRRSSGTAGSFLKASETRKGVHWYYKLSDYDAWRGIVGHECINEIIVDRLLTLLKIPHLSYQLIYAKIIIDGKEYITWLCRSEDLKKQATVRSHWMPIIKWSGFTGKARWSSAFGRGGRNTFIKC